VLDLTGLSDPVVQFYMDYNDLTTGGTNDVAMVGRLDRRRSHLDERPDLGRRLPRPALDLAADRGRG